MKTADKFIYSGFGRWINSRTGRLFRTCAGLFFSRGTPLGIFALVWFVFPLSAGLFDVCYISAVLGGPLRGDKIRRWQQDA